jgi:hypothetical protein
MDDEWSVETPPRRFTPKRQKTDPEVKIKLTYLQQGVREDHILHVLFLQTILSVNNDTTKENHVLAGDSGVDKSVKES